MASPSCVNELLVQPITREEVTDDLRAFESKVALAAVEDAWKHFLRLVPDEELPKSKRTERIDSLKEQIADITESKDRIEHELRKQLDFLQKSHQEIENNFDEEMRAADKQKRLIHQEVEQQQHLTRKAEALQKQTLPWFHFLEEINSAVAQQERCESSALSNILSIASSGNLESRGPKPSGRALLLQKSEHKEKHDDVAHPEYHLHAHRIDHALLTNHVQALRREIERMEILASTQDYCSGFLNEHNAFDLLNDAEFKDDASLRTMSTIATMDTIQAT